jgi:uncharacterized protein (TIGR03000 family)
MPASADEQLYSIVPPPIIRNIYYTPTLDVVAVPVAFGYQAPFAGNFGYSYPPATYVGGYNYAYPNAGGYNYAYPYAGGYNNAFPYVGGYNYAYGFGSAALGYWSNPNYALGYQVGYDYRGFPWNDPRYMSLNVDNYYYTTPDAPRYQSAPVNTAAATTTASTAQITLNVPLDADVSVDGTTTQQTGPVRTFVTPNLTGPTAYEVKVRRTVEGKAVEDVMKVSVRPGDSTSIHILQ